MADEIIGRVQDPTGAPIAGARVRRLGDGNPAVAFTDRDGRFEIAAAAARGRLEVQASGFARAVVALDRAPAPLRIVLLPSASAEAVIVTATRTRTALADAPASVSIVSEEDLRATAAPTLDDALRQVAGFSLFRRAGSRTANPTSQGASLRGVGASGASRAAVLDDGVPLNDPFGGWVYWGRVPRASVDRIEVVRGGTSDLYGSGALAGTVHLLRREAAPAAVHAVASVGSQATAEGSAFGAAGWRDWRSALALERLTTDGYAPVSASERGAVDRAVSSEHATVDLTLERVWSPGGRAFARGSYYQEARNNGTLLQTNDTLDRQVAAGGEHRGLSLRVYAGRQRFHQGFSAIAADRASERLTRLQSVPSDVRGGLVEWTRAVGRRNVLVAGLDHRDVKGSSVEVVFSPSGSTSRAVGGGRQRTEAAYLEDLLSATRRLSFGVGARLDAWRNLEGNRIDSGRVSSLPDRGETALSPRLTALFKASPRLSVSASAYRAFRAPTLNELYRTFRVGNVVTSANDRLDAEHGAGMEGGLRFEGGRWWTRATAFWTDVRDPIANVTLSVAPDLITRQRQNLGRTRARGVEAEAAARLGQRARLSGSYLWVDSRVLSFPADRTLEDARVPQVPRHQASGQLRYEAPARVVLAVQARWQTAQFEDDQNLLPLAGFTALDAVVSRPLGRGVLGFLSVENATDTRYEIGRTPVRTLGPPRAVHFGLRLDR